MSHAILACPSSPNPLVYFCIVGKAHNWLPTTQPEYSQKSAGIGNLPSMRSGNVSFGVNTPHLTVV